MLAAKIIYNENGNETDAIKCGDVVGNKKRASSPRPGIGRLSSTNKWEHCFNRQKRRVLKTTFMLESKNEDF
jgi:hypothetical protein